MRRWWFAVSISDERRLNRLVGSSGNSTPTSSDSIPSSLMGALSVRDLRLHWGLDSVTGFVVKEIPEPDSRAWEARVMRSTSSSVSARKMTFVVRGSGRGAALMVSGSPSIFSGWIKESSSGRATDSTGVGDSFGSSVMSVRAKTDLILIALLSINQSINQSVNQSINQSITHSIKQRDPWNRFSRCFKLSNEKKSTDRSQNYCELVESVWLPPNQTISEENHL